jgi:hypothetical protein
MGSVFSANGDEITGIPSVILFLSAGRCYSVGIFEFFTHNQWGIGYKLKF